MKSNIRKFTWCVLLLIAIQAQAQQRGLNIEIVDEAGQAIACFSTLPAMDIP
ncbi:MAG: hypothetical protein RBT80_18625 [Candidatus Vecturithrix sp.]|jgi:hypothetical protein|nr:hypothetical protein [Candidatus Vecturithrix sp.]